MPKRPQFSLKALLVIIAVLAVPLGMLVGGNGDLAAAGVVFALHALFGSIGYLLGRWTGAAIGVLLAFIAMCLTGYLYVTSWQWR